MDIRPLTRIARKAHPVAQCVRMDHDASGRIVALEATDIDLSLRIERPDASIAGSFLCPLTKELSAARGLNLETARIEYSKGSPLGRLVTTGSTVSAGDPDEYPPLGAFETGSSISIEAADMARLHREACYCVPTDDNRYGLNGAHFETTDGGIRVVCTDGNRLAWSEADTDGEPVIPRHKLHDPRFLSLAGSLIVGRVSLSYAVNAPVVRATGETSDGWTVEIRSRLVDGEFPAYRSVLPAREATRKNPAPWRVSLATSDLIGALGIVKPYASGQAQQIEILCEPGRETVAIHGRAVDVGEAFIRTRAMFDGEDRAARLFGFNCGYLLETIKAWPEERITLELREPLSSLCFYTEGERCCAVVMPIRTDMDGLNVPADTAVYEAPVKAARQPTAKRTSKPAPKMEAAPTTSAAPCPDCAELRASVAYAEQEARDARDVSGLFGRELKAERKAHQEAARDLEELRHNTRGIDGALTAALDRIAALEAELGRARDGERIARAGEKAARDGARQEAALCSEAVEAAARMEARIAQLESQCESWRTEAREKRIALEATRATTPEPQVIEIEEPEPTICIPRPAQRTRFVVSGGNLRAMAGDSAIRRSA